MEGNSTRFISALLPKYPANDCYSTLGDEKYVYIHIKYISYDYNSTSRVQESIFDSPTLY